MSIEENIEEAVKVTIKATPSKKNPKYISFSVSIPRKIAERYGIKGGEILLVRIVKARVNGKDIEGIFFYKPRQ